LETDTPSVQHATGLIQELGLVASITGIHHTDAAQWKVPKAHLADLVETEKMAIELRM